MEEHDRAGRTELHYAALEDDLTRAMALITAGADLDDSDREGFSPLHFAAQQHAVAVARLLIESGAKVDPVNKHGNTPLWTAVFNTKGGSELVKLLRKAGADPNHANAAGRTPAQLARLMGTPDVVRFFAD